MTKRMLIDATHAEETRVVVLDGNRLEDFDVETSTKKQLKGNIYLAKIVRVEPSLQAAFVEYGGGRHGFLAFAEIHPDYYQIPIADRERLLRLQEEEARAEEDAADAAESGETADEPTGQPRITTPEAIEPPPADEAPYFLDAAVPDGAGEEPALPENAGGAVDGAPEPTGLFDQLDLDVPIHPAPDGGDTRMPELPAEEAPPEQGGVIDNSLPDSPAEPQAAEAAPTGEGSSFADSTPADAALSDASLPNPAEAPESGEAPADAADAEHAHSDHAHSDHAQSDHAHSDHAQSDIETVAADALPPETMGGEGDGSEDGRERRMPARFLRNYKIQEVMRRRQILLVQVVKEERGTKGAALTTYVSLAGRFSVLMPNSPRGGGISRKITSAADRRRLKEITQELDLPSGMGLIVRTAGAARPKPEIKRDCEYLLRLWDDIRDNTMRSVAPALIHEEATLIKRAIRDVYSRDVDEVLVDGEEGWRAARDVMRMLMPSHARKVISWRDHPASGGQPLFASQNVDKQLDDMMSPNVQLRSGGYLVINQTEALVAIDVNSGRSTRERGIEETAVRTNLEAAEEVARQLRLRDLAGLIVIDFIDMESKKHNLSVERRLKDALKNDRARIQVGSISHFGLMEMSRQRLRPSLAENSFVTCPHCAGIGHVRSTESASIHVLRGIEEEGAKRRAAEIAVHVAPAIAMYILNHKRDRLLDIEQRYSMQILFSGDPSLIAPQMRIDRTRAAVPVTTPEPLPPPVAAVSYTEPVDVEEEEDAGAPDETAVASEEAPAAAVSAEDAEASRRRRRRRRRGGRRDETGAPEGETSEGLPDIAALGAEQPDLLPAGHPAPTADAPVAEAAPGEPAALEASNAGEPAVGEPAAHAEPASSGDTMAAADAPAGDGIVSAAEAVPAAEDLDGDGKPRRRGRRGGRRRRRDVTEEGAEAEIAPEPPPPVYTGPTPANPFGGTFDIFDVMEQAEQALPPLAAVAVPPPPAEELIAATAAPPETAIPEPAAPDPVAPKSAAPAPVVAEPAAVESVVAEPVVAEPAVAEPVAAEPIAAEPIAAEPIAAEHGATQPAPAAEPSPLPALHLMQPEPEPPPSATEPLIKPMLIDSDAPAPERKRGWWRR